MPFDARITILIQAPGEYDEHGEYTAGAETPYRRWAQEYGAGSSDAFEGSGQGGTRVTSGRTFLVRWFHALAIAPESFVFVVDNLGQRWYTDGINVGDPRKRFIVISSLRVVSALLPLGDNPC